MNGKNFNNPSVKLRVLIAPLDWGLGHATRCIPIIKELIANGLEVFIAASGATEALLKKEFPQLQFLSLRGYNIFYSKNKNLLFLKILSQFPKIVNTLRYEHRWLKQCIATHKIDLVISDNRPGLYHRTIPVIYMTHQLKIKTGNAFSSWIAQKIHYHYINKFTQCWVPDAVGTMNLAGELSHPPSLPKISVKYLGPLSRFENKDRTEKKYDLLILLSGPEPQRSIFEEKIMDALKSYTGKAVLIRGLPGNSVTQQYNNAAIQQYNHLAADELNTLIRQSHFVISRSGYTTVMDLVKLKQKAVLVPTPGQYEQEYLGAYLMEKKLFYCIRQKDISLEAITNAAAFPFDEIIFEEKYKSVIQNFLQPSL